MEGVVDNVGDPENVSTADDRNLEENDDVGSAQFAEAENLSTLFMGTRKKLVDLCYEVGRQCHTNFYYYFLYLTPSVCKLISLQNILLIDYILLKRGSSRIDILENTKSLGV